MRALFLAAALVTAAVPAASFAQAAAKYTTASTTIEKLLADPAAKAVLEKHLPQIVEYASAIGAQTLKQVQEMSGGQIPDKLLADIDADLAKIK